MYTTASMFVIVSTGYVIQTLSLCIFIHYITTILSLRIFVLYSLFCVYSFFADRISNIEVRRSKQRRIGLSILIMKKTQQKEERKKMKRKENSKFKNLKLSFEWFKLLHFWRKSSKNLIHSPKHRDFGSEKIFIVCIDFCSPT